MHNLGASGAAQTEWIALFCAGDLPTDLNDNYKLQEASNAVSDDKFLDDARRNCPKPEFNVTHPNPEVNNLAYVQA